MAKLQIKDESGKTTTVPLTRDEITIGRKEGNTIRLTERNVSRTHARFIKKGEEIHVEDLSRYGTRVNGERITETRRVGAGDTIQIGDYLLTLDGVKAVEDAGQRLAAAGAAAQAAAIPESKPRDDKKKAEIEAAARNQIAAAKAEALAEAKGEGKKDAPAPASKKEPTIPPSDEEMRKSRGAGKKRIGAVHPTLVAVTTHLAGTEYPITAETMILGRTGENDLKVDHHSISRNHAKVVVKDGKVKMVDLQSKNGIRVNGEYWEESSLKSGDIVELGKVQFRYVEKGEEFIFRPEDYTEGGVAAAAAPVEAKKGGKGLLVALLLLAAGGLAAVYFLVIAKPSDKPNVPNVPVGTAQPETKPPETKPPTPDTTAAVQADTAAAVQADTAAAVATKAAPDAAVAKVDHSAEIKDLLGKAKAAVDAQKWDDADKSLAAALALDAENADAKALQAKVGSEKAVGAAYAEAQAAQSKNDLQAAWAALGKLASMPADSVYAARVNELKNAVGPAIANGYIDQAKQALAKKQWNDAIAKAEEAQKVVANQAEAPDIIAKARKGKAEDAKKEAEKAAKDPNKDPAKDPTKNPKDPPKTGKTGEELYKEARAIHNTDPGSALKLYEQAAAAGYASAYKMIGSIKIQKGDNAGAIAAYKRYLSLVPTAKDADTVRDIIIRLGGTP
ncbi:MAG: FHA domain-containing protein [Deltaproteobacteria bacterium]|nr:FHA domain-containing protein [Deltaproteobacteria bacterium]